MESPNETQKRSTGRLGSSGCPSETKRWPSWKIHTSAPNEALIESAFMKTALNGKSSERRSTSTTMNVAPTTNDERVGDARAQEVCRVDVVGGLPADLERSVPHRAHGADRAHELLGGSAVRRDVGDDVENGRVVLHDELRAVPRREGAPARSGWSGSRGAPPSWASRRKLGRASGRRCSRRGRRAVARRCGARGPRARRPAAASARRHPGSARRRRAASRRGRGRPTRGSRSHGGPRCPAGSIRASEAATRMRKAGNAMRQEHEQRRARARRPASA